MEKVSDDLDNLFREMDEKRRSNFIKRFMNDRFHGGIGGMNPTYIFFPKYWPRMANHYIWIVRCRWVRGKKGYAITDTFSLDSYILSWLPDAVKDLREGLYGHPIDMSFEEWQEILEDIENGLRDGQKAYNWEDEFDQAEHDRRLRSFRYAWDLMGEHFFSMWN